MNCCNSYGQCCRGQGCPCRESVAAEGMPVGRWGLLKAVALCIAFWVVVGLLVYRPWAG